MKVSELIQKLTNMKRRHGDLDVLITGSYGSMTDTLEVKSIIEMNTRFVQIETDLCSG